jgi:translation initiation factor IF-3
MRFRGREVVHADLAAQQLLKMAEELGDIAVVEKPAKLEGRNMTIILAPK